jgi:hypothetical protein
MIRLFSKKTKTELRSAPISQIRYCCTRNYLKNKVWKNERTRALNMLNIFKQSLAISLIVIVLLSIWHQIYCLSRHYEVPAAEKRRYAQN